MFMEHEPRDQGEQHIAQGGRGQHISQISPRQCGRVAGEKTEKEQDSDRHPGIENGENYASEMMNRDCADLLHAMREHGIASSGKDGDAGQHKVFTEGHLCFRRRSARYSQRRWKSLRTGFSNSVYAFTGSLAAGVWLACFFTILLRAARNFRKPLASL